MNIEKEIKLLKEEIALRKKLDELNETIIAQLKRIIQDKDEIIRVQRDIIGENQ